MVSASRSRHNELAIEADGRDPVLVANPVYEREQNKDRPHKHPLPCARNLTLGRR